MSPERRRSLRLALALFAAALAQSVYANAIQIRGAQPDFLILTVILGALFCDANGGATLGFFAGLLHASLAAPPHGGFGSLIVSRTLVGFGIGWLEERVFRDNPLIALTLVALGTALADTLFFVFAPQPDIPHWARVLGLTTLYNTVLALPFYYLFRRLLRPEQAESSL